jgi:hypothetical protein
MKIRQAIICILPLVACVWIAGCATPDPVKSWNSWSPIDEETQRHAALDKAIKADYLAYAHKVWPKGRDFFIFEVEYYEDGTGRHAVRIVLEPGLHKYKEYYLMYDTNNVRTKVIRIHVPAVWSLG